MQFPRRGQTFSTEPLKNPPVSDDPGGTDTAITADRQRQETVCENLGVRDTSWLAVGEFFPLTTRAEAAYDETHKRHGEMLPFFLHRNTRCVPDAEQYQRFIPHVWLTVDLELKAEQRDREMLSFLCYLFPRVICNCSLK